MSSLESSSLKILALDIGYGDTKGTCDALSFSFKSGFAPFRSSEDAAGGSYGIRIHVSKEGEAAYDLGPFIVGETSLLYPGYREPAGNERLGTDDALVLLGEAVLRGKIDGEIVLATGAPLDLYLSEKTRVQNWKGLTLTVESTDGRSHSVTISDIVTRPQGVAAAMALAAIDQLPSDSGIGVVLDIGSRTTDVVCVALSTKGIDPIRPLCFSLPVAVGDIFNLVGEGISKELGGFRPPRALVQLAITREKFSYGGKTCDVRPILTNAREQIAATLSQEIKRRLGEKGDMVVSVIAVGGGSLPFLLGTVVDKIFPGVPVVSVSKDYAIFMNAAGYQYAAQKRE